MNDNTNPVLKEGETPVTWDALLSSVPSGDNSSFTRYIVIGTPRAGTSLLSSVLRKHNQVRSFGELFNPLWVPLGSIGLGRVTNPHLLRYRQDRPIDFIEKICCPLMPEYIRAVGFKIFYGHLDGLGKITDYLLENKYIKIIHLKRRNILRQFVSLKLALETGIWGITSREQQTINTVSVSVDEFLNAADSILDRQRLYEKRFSDHPYMDLYYEDLDENQNEKLKEIQSFIGVDMQALKPDLIKRNILPLPEVISNFSEVVAGLKHSPYSEFVD